MIPGNVSIRADFVGESYPAFCVVFQPEGEVRGQILYIPPFAEEMNRCRAIVADQARWFAGSGYICGILDFFGTGESPGDLNETSLAIWRQNISEAITYIGGKSDLPLCLWGCRLGAMIAINYLASYPDQAQSLLLWQPAVSGKTFITQMLRQRTAALMERGEASESTAEMRTRMASGASLEVAGYTLGGGLIAEIDQLEVSGASQFANKSVYWLEHSTDASGTPAPRSARVIASLEESGAMVEFRQFGGQPLWQLHERDNCDELLLTSRSLPW